MQQHSFKLLNPVIRTLILSDVLIISSFGLFAPFFAIYIIESVKGGLEVVGIAATVYLLVKSLGQLIIARVIDKIRGESDDFRTMVAGSFVVALIPLFYIFVMTPFQLYLVQALYGLAMAFVFPAWMAIFTRHINVNQEGTQWGIYFTTVDLSNAIAASVGGFLAASFGFTPIFVIVSILTFCGALVLFAIRRQLTRRHNHHNG
ncbi:MAG: hypothetical protein A3H06_01205 [Candidatus Colwellbacteria bacterium RIFCSPLOWO2_12_FULL_44_13]|uniref:Major facilitator superfamily (MFS) profile domain-containing protein n=3 Tax=Candidatus Colwelliibacteriota TaxID=1817904 RepID=A0A1G1Z634_9BACT|nr:MAG: hypothetical protein A3F24_01735 [Candidatus Colwellbacteria bacterium RIFCSPHIGHO2_12_FULL_44_17]OGY60073.1 MAG: hypothetical protein A3I31_02965 [Candidatus Colwellbacteria bacterium RIFCSPLOWO2_02_FULL_44_20b]OGY61454.1 MAG: hypothetical protein A3H06_01205 [Candidatus Colwellbacteria bacterium RIFCSPLOWO2_12_FULL_44_13]